MNWVGKLHFPCEYLNSSCVKKDVNVSGKEEEEMLLEWFSLHQERHLLVRRDKELGYL